MTATQAPTEIQELATRYGEAWNSQDLDAIMALHTDDCVFCAHAAGSPPAEGKQAVREAFAGYIALMPDINFAERVLRVGEDHWVLESTMTGTLAGSLEVEGVDPAAGFVAADNDVNGARVEVECVDVIEVRDGLIVSKHTYLDSLAMQRQLEGS
jgi:steroid delta-isomerase-like uncharacterized protein